MGVVERVARMSTLRFSETLVCDEGITGEPDGCGSEIEIHGEVHREDSELEIWEAVLGDCVCRDEEAWQAIAALHLDADDVGEEAAAAALDQWADEVYHDAMGG